ncbi:hypothetical protein GCM10022408_09110 [Hymenobacter fastidiosus]|uniref:IPT/TIG domain-containing protein n=1 Tax=Hymenobacter fastidiosus TaxID=486264 RepID=A0ABP7RP83_9BACT
MKFRLPNLLRLIFVLASYLLTTVSQAQSAAPVVNLIQYAGGPTNSGYSTSEPQGMVTDAQGSTYLKGNFAGTVQFGAFTLTSPGGLPTGYLVKLDQNGNCQWALQHPAFDWSGRSLALDAAGNVYITTSYSESLDFGAIHLTTTGSGIALVVVKIDPAGNYVWARQVEGSCGIVATALAVDAQNNVYLTGWFGTGTIQIGATTLTNTNNSAYNPANLFVAKLSAAGTWLWGAQSVRLSFNYYSEQGTGIAVDAAGSVYVTGSLGSSSASLGATVLTNAGYTDALVAKLSSNGAWEWAYREGAPGYDSGTAVAVDNSGNVLLYGNIHGTPDASSPFSLTPTNGAFEVFVAKLTPAGTVLWATTGGGTEAEVAGNLVLDAAGNAYVTGWFDSAPARFGPTELTNTGQVPNHDVFVAKVSGTGQWQWALAAAGSYMEAGIDVSVDAQENVWLTGITRSATLAMGPLVLTGIYPRGYGFLARLVKGQLASVTAIAPSSGAPGQTVTITGTNFTGVNGVAFNGIPAPAFTVFSATSLQATVPGGASSGPVTVQTAAGSSGPGSLFQVIPLAAASALDAAVRVWPNPVSHNASLYLELPGSISAGHMAQISLTTMLGQTALRQNFSGRSTRVPLVALAPGVYVLTLRLTGQTPVIRRIIIE